MTKKERANFIDCYLDKRYPNPLVPLAHKDPYTLLIAVLLSAQCTDERVNRISPLLFAIADNPVAMSRLSEKKIESIIRPCGLAPMKSKGIFNLSKILINEYDKKVPQSIDLLEGLPGVGHKTASVVMSQAFGIPTFPVDTHIHRLAQRWSLTSGKNVKETEKDLKRLFPISRWNKLHLQIIFYGREFCTARGCDGLKCELCVTLFPNRRRPVRTKK